MKFLRDIVEKLEPKFAKGEKLHKWFPLFDGFATFLFVPGHTTKNGVHVRDAIDMKRTMNTVITALIPCLLFGIWNAGYQHYTALGMDSTIAEELGYGALLVLPIVITSYVVGLAVEFAFCIIKGHQINEGFLVSGMLIPLIVPVETPLWMIAVATAFAVVFGKEVFGGTGMNILNPALTARAFLFFSYPTWMSGDKVWVNTDLPCEATAEAGKILSSTGEVIGQVPDATAGATQLANWYNRIDADKVIEKAESALAAAKASGVDAKIQTATDNLNEATEVLSGLEAQAYSTAELAIGAISGSIGETSAIAIGLGAMILIATGIGNWKIMISGLIGGALMALIFNLAGANPFMDVPVLDQILAGGFLFGLVFMATDPVTAAQTEAGKLIYGFLIGVFAIMIRVFNPAYPEGVMLAILFMNVMAPLIDHYVIQGNIKERIKRAEVAAAH